MWLAIACRRSSGVVSTSTCTSPYRMTTLGRVRWSRGSMLVQTSQAQPIIGTPALVPEPRKTSSTDPARGRRRLGKGRVEGDGGGDNGCWDILHEFRGAGRRSTGFPAC